MGSVVQNGWDQLAGQCLDLIALTLLYYDYALTFDYERRLFWSRQGITQWGSILFFLNRYCGIIGYIPVFTLLFARPGSALYHLCKPVYLYHQLLAVIMQSIVVVTFVTRTYALYDRSRVVLVGLTTLALAGAALGGGMIAGGEKLGMDPVLPGGSTGCPVGLSWSQSWRLAVAWGGVMFFDLIVVTMTLVKTVQLNRRSGGGYTIVYILMRDGVMYFGIISLTTLSNIVSFLYGSELTRGIVTTLANALASVLVSRLMFNLRDKGTYYTTATDTTQIPVSTTIQQYMDTQDVYELEAAISKSPGHQGETALAADNREGEIISRRDQ